MKVFDIENDSVDPVLSFETSSDESTLRTNAVVVHPTMPIVVSAHEDRQIKFWDLNNGESSKEFSMSSHFDFNLLTFQQQESVYIQWSLTWMKLLVWQLIQQDYSFSQGVSCALFVFFFNRKT
jgi:WD40 repeat protein